MARLPLISVDLGNARAKLGLFTTEPTRQLPEPVSTLVLDGQRPEFGQITSWLKETGQPHVGWSIGSVNRPATGRLMDWIRQHRPADPTRILAHGDLPLVVEMDRPGMVGIDRLLDAVAANWMRQEDRAAVVVDMGTAITVDLVSADGRLRGGAILPGIAMAAQALHEFTDLLPHIDPGKWDTAPPALGTDTAGAIRSGLFWGTIGAIRQLVEQWADDQPQVLLTGGAGPVVAKLLGQNALYVPHLTLAGIALTAYSLP